jgi:RimJ/RimL family protein N-acetyltransferase
MSVPLPARGVALRPATPDDARALWEWRNDATTRAMSLDRDPIPFAAHEEWLRRQLSRDDVALFIVEEGGQPVGQVRVERRPEGGATVSIGLAAAARGRGIGGAALARLASPETRPTWANPLVALIRPENVASQRMFERAGYVGPRPAGDVNAWEWRAAE